MFESEIYTVLDPSNWTHTTMLLMITVCILVQRLFFSRSDTKRYKVPPSPRFKLPIIGHLHLLSTDIGKPLRRFRRELGDIYSLQLGNRACVVISGLTPIKDALVKNGDVFLDRPHLPVLNKITRGAGMFSACGEKWKEHRLFTQKTLKTFGMGKSILQIKIHEEIKLLFEAIDTVNGEPLDPKVCITTGVGNILCSMVFGSTFKHGDNTFKNLIDGIDENLSIGVLNGVLNFLPFLRLLPGDPFCWKTMIQNSDMMFDFVKVVIAEHIENLDEENINDYVSAYVHHLNDMDQLGKPTTFNLPELAATFFDLFGAGVETTVSAMMWALPILAENQEIQNRMFDEIQTHVGNDRLPTIEDRIKLAYVEAFYMEIMRYTQSNTVNAPRVVTRDTEFHGYSLRAGTIVLIDFGSIWTDPDLMPNPNKFDPDRFLDASGRLLKAEEFFPFGLGKRNCVGESLARMELLLFLSALVQRYEIVFPEGISMAKIGSKVRVVCVPNPYTVVFRERR